MLFKKINKIKLILGKRNSVYLLYYFLFSSFVVLLEAIGIGLIPVIFSGLMDQSLILNKLDFNETVYNFVYNVFNNKNFFVLIPIIIFLFFLIKTSINVIFIFFEFVVSEEQPINLMAKNDNNNAIVTIIVTSDTNTFDGNLERK